MKKGLSPVLWLLLAVFLLRAFVPAGFMPDMSGKNIMVICSGMGMTTIMVDENNQPLPDQPNPKFIDHCPFAGLNIAFLNNPNAGLPLLLPPPVTAEGMTAFFLTGILPTSLHNNHLSRAPPQFS